MKMKTPSLLFLCLIVHFSIQGQQYINEFGKLGKDEIELKTYPKGKDAHAVVLFDIGRSYFVNNDRSFDVVFERSTRIKVLSEAGNEWAQVEIPFYQEGGIYETVSEIEAYAYNYENGIINKTPLDLSNVYEEKVNNYWNVKKFAVPNVKEGTIIEYRYKINSQYMFNLRDWEFQWRIPVIHSEYQVEMIPFYEYTYLLQGASSFTSQKSFVSRGMERRFGSVTFQDMIHNYVMKEVPAFDNEEFITSINDYIVKIDFQLSKINYPEGGKVDVMTTWEEMNKELLKHKDFGKYIQGAEKLAAKVMDLDGEQFDNEMDKFNFIIDHVKKNYNWDKTHGRYASKSPKKFVEEKFGNVLDVNLFAIGLLNASGIEAKPVLLSTRSNGKIAYDYPFTHFFNYVIILAIVDGQKVLSDATEVLSLNHRIPSRCINEKGLIVQKDQVEWMGLECLFPSSITTNFSLEITNDAQLLVGISKYATEYDALQYRNAQTSDQETIAKSLEKLGYDVIDTSIAVKNQLDRELPYVLNYQLKTHPELVNDKIYISPFLSETTSDNPLKQNERSYPVDITYPKRRVFRSIIAIPEGYSVDYLPAGQRISSDLFDLNYSASINGNLLTVTFDYYFKNTVYAPADYSKVKSYFDQIVKKGNEKIVLQKSAELSRLDEISSN